MTKITLTDLQILNLGIIGKGNFNEKDIAKSELAKLGVGRILDQLASLKERNLIRMNKDGSFAITEDAKKVLWDPQMPTEIKILRILEIGPQMSQKLALFLLMSEGKIQDVLEELQKNHLVLMSTVKNDMGIVKMFEILPEGVEYLEKSNSSSPQSFSKLNLQIKSIQILQDMIKKIKELEGISEETKTEFILNLQKVKKSLEN